MTTNESHQAAPATSRLLSWACGTGLDDIPRPVLRRAARVLADDLAVIIAARDEPEVARFHADMLGGDPQPQATVFRGGRRAQTDRARAAMANGLAGCWLELDEGYRKAGCHAGLFTLPALLAEAEAARLSVGELLRCLVLAYEVTTRVARAWRLDRHPIHGHARYASVGATAAVSLARGLPPEMFHSALTAAATFAFVGPHAHGHDGVLVRNAWPALGAATGFLCVSLAQAGIGGHPAGLHEVYGKVLGGQAEHGELTKALSSSWAILDGYSKRHACCQYAHAAVEASLVLRQQMQGCRNIRNIRSIRVDTHDLAVAMRETEPRTVLAAKFSVPHIVATTLVHGHADVAAFAPATLDDPEIAALRRVTQTAAWHGDLQPPHDRPARVRVDLLDGRTLEAECLSAPGGPDDPYPDEFVLEKAARLTAAVHPRLHPLMLRIRDGEPAVLEAAWADLVREFTSEPSSEPSPEPSSD